MISTVDAQRSMPRVLLTEVHNNLLHLYVQREIVVGAPRGQAAHFAPVVILISAGVQLAGQQGKEKRAQHTFLGGPRMMLLDLVFPLGNPPASCTARF